MVTFVISNRKLIWLIRLIRANAVGQSLIFSAINEKDKLPGTFSPQAVKCGQIDQTLPSGVTQRHQSSLHGSLFDAV